MDGRRMYFFFLLFVALWLPGCGSKPPVTELLEPQKLATTWELGYDNDGNPFCSHRGGTGPSFKPVEGQVLAGYDNSFRRWGFLGACYEKIDHVYRGGVRFNLSKFKRDSIVRADLEFWRQEPSGRCEVSCNLATGDWGEGFFEGRLPTDRESRNFVAPIDTTETLQSVNVTAEVRDWVNGDRPNLGFVFLGGDESFPKNNERCVNAFAIFRLRIVHSTAAP